MGRQVSFWMLEQDEQEFMRFVLSDPEVVMIAQLSQTPAPRTITELPDPDERWGWSVHFGKKSYRFKTSVTVVQPEAKPFISAKKHNF
jgi:hypothetical protein